MPRGKPEVTCGAKRKNGELCTMAAGWGTPHNGTGRCAFHGGKTPNHLKKAEREELARQVKILGIPVEGVSPAQGLMRELSITLGELAWLRAEITAAEGKDPGSAFRGAQVVRRTVDSAGAVSTVSEVSAGLSTRMLAYEKWKRLYRDQVAVAIAHGIADRQIELAERGAEIHGAVLAAALDAIGAAGEVRLRAIVAAKDRYALLRSEPESA